MESFNATFDTTSEALTGAFETSVGFPDWFTGLAGDFDGEGISFGVLQWNIGQGTLQPLFAQMLRDHRQIMTQIFQDNLAHFTSMLSLSREGQLAWWASVQSPDKAELFKPWKGYLLTLGRTSSYQQIQMDHSAQIYSDALALAQEFDLHTERSVALMFDTLVQNGGIDSAMKTLIEADSPPLLAVRLILTMKLQECRRLPIVLPKAAGPNTLRTFAPANWSSQMVLARFTAGTMTCLHNTALR